MNPVVVRVTLLTLLGLCVAACNSTPKPRTEIALSDSALQSAELAGAREHAPIELRAAREKRDAVDVAMRRKDYERARRYSQQTVVDAELAKARAEAVKSAMALEEARNGMRLMQDELQRVKQN